MISPFARLKNYININTNCVSTPSPESLSLRKILHLVARILNIILAFLVFFSTTGFVVNKHFCQNELRQVSLFVKGESCHHKMEKMASMEACPMKGMKKSCSKDGSCSNQQSSKKKKNCCHDESRYVKSEQTQEKQSVEFPQLNNPVLVGVLFIALKIELPSIDAHTLPFLTYKPPIVGNDIQVLLQTFLL